MTLYKKNKNHEFNKIIIGTAQFNSDYGIVKKKNRNSNELILYANKINLSTFEISTLYNNSIKKIIKNSINPKFIIKISSKKNSKYVALQEFNKKIKDLIKIIGIKKIYCFMFHDLNFWDKIKFNDYQKSLITICKKNKIKFGYSIYHMKEFNFLEKNYEFNLLQIPLNVFNHEFLSKRFKKIVIKKKIEIHARSVFLQGVLTNDLNNLPNDFKKFKKYFMYWENFCKKKNITKVNAAINFVLNQSFVNKVVLGFKDNYELVDLTTNFKKFIINCPIKFKKIPSKLKHPFLWKQIK